MSILTQVSDIMQEIPKMLLMRSLSVVGSFKGYANSLVLSLFKRLFSVGLKHPMPVMRILSILRVLWGRAIQLS